MRRRKPLMFISSPVIRRRRYTPPEEESTSVFEPERPKTMPENTTITEILPVEPAKDIEQSDPNTERLRENLEYLNHPFRRDLYTPLEFVLHDERIIGKLQNYDDGTAWIESNDGVLTIALEDLLDIVWKQQSFIR